MICLHHSLVHVFLIFTYLLTSFYRSIVIILIIDETIFALLSFQGLKGQSNRRLISLEEVKKHKTGDCIWTVLKGRVYNIAPYMKFHPGGNHLFQLMQSYSFFFFAITVLPLQPLLFAL